MLQKYSLLTIMLLVLLTNCPAQTGAPMIMLAFASDRAGNGDIFLADRWGRLTNLTRSPEGDWDPQWSPDGQTIAFTGHRSGQADIWLMAPDGNGQTNLTNNPAWDYSPAWSPDGRQLAFVSERDGDAEIFIQAVNGGDAVQLTRNTHQDKLPNWSPAGDKLAFAAVINGAEQIYTLSLAPGNAITPLLPPGLNGTGPVWNPAGNALAFIGWQNTDSLNIYTLNLAAGQFSKRYTSTTWIGSLNWPADGEWLLFTGRTENNHNLMALRLDRGEAYPLTFNPAWDDFPALRPQSQFQPIPLDPAAITGGPPRRDPAFGYGVNLADLSNAYLIQDIGFTAIKGYVNWGTIEAAPGEYRWTDPDNIMHAAAGAGASVLLRVHGAPPWARPPDTPFSYPPLENLPDFARFMGDLAQRYRGRVAGYEIWNEPNLNYEWGYRPPNPAEYAALLKTAYRAVKAGDPAALVISAGPAPTGDGNPPEALGDLDFVDGMYRAGAKGFFDALGSHPYTYGRPPDFDSPTGITLTRLAQQRQLMLNYGDGDTPIWITEMGWNLATHWDLGEYHNQGVSQIEQAQYLQRAYRKIETEWPWIKAAYLFNLDFSAAPWYPAAEQMRWYAILNPDRTPRPAYTALREYQSP